MTEDDLKKRNALLREALLAAHEELARIAQAGRKFGFGTQMEMSTAVTEKVKATLEAGDDWAEGLDAQRATALAAYYRGGLKEVMGKAKAGTWLDTLARKFLQIADSASEILLRKEKNWNELATALAALENLYEHDAGVRTGLKAGRTTHDVEGAETDVRRHARDAVTLFEVLSGDGLI